MGTSIQRILVASDFSEHARLALDRAALLARQHGASMELVYAAPLPLPTPVWGGDLGIGAGVDAAEVVQAGLGHLQKLAALVRDRFGIEPVLRCEPRAPLPLLRARCEDWKPDLLVIGATGEGAIARRLFGSTAQSIVRGATVPVLVVRGAAEREYGHLLAATDFSEDAQRAIHVARALAPAAELTLFSALDLPSVDAAPLLGLDPATREANLARAGKQVEASLRILAGELGAPEARICVRTGRASHELPGVVESTAADLLCLGAHGKGRIESALLGSTSLHAAAEAGCDVLVVPHSS
jgi:nucleotide-binding universal stress UspA family protein